MILLVLAWLNQSLAFSIRIKKALGHRAS